MPSDTPVDAGEIPQRQFNTARRGLDPGEVRAYLHQVSETVASLQRATERERLRADAAEQRAEQAERPDQQQMVELLGSETARVLDAARDAARDIRAKAEASAERLISEANDQAHERLAQAEAEMLEARSQMLAEVEDLRRTAAGELDRRRDDAEQMVDEMRREAQLAADGLRQEGEKERAVAATDAEDLREAARDEARRMIAEAEMMRERVLGDLERRRRAAREQLERLNGARGRLLAAYEVVRRTVDEATGELTTALPEAKVASDAAVRRVQASPEASLEELESDVAMARIAGLLPPRPETPDLDAILEPASSLPPDDLDEAEPDDQVDGPDLADTADDVEVAEADAQAEADDPADASDDVQDAEVLVEPEVDDSEDAGDEVDEPAVLEESEIDDRHVEVAEVLELVEAEELRQSVKETPSDASPNGAASPVEAFEVQLEIAVAEHEHERVVPDVVEHPVVAGDPVDAVDLVFARLKGGVVGAASDDVLLRQRNETLEPLERALSRRLKRVLADEQNEVLDAVRRGKAQEEAELLPGSGAHADRYGDTAADELHTAAYWGAAAVEGQWTGSCETLIDELGRELALPLRERVLHSVAEAEGDADELTARLRSLYREWKGQWVGNTVRHYIAAAYAQGAYEAAGDEATLRWVVDPDCGSCPDADANALAGPLRKGDAFPTGHCAPPAHPGCRCLAMPAATTVVVTPVGASWVD